MRLLLLIALVLVGANAAAAQNSGRDVEVETVKNAVWQLAAARDQRVEIVLRDLREVKGDVVGAHGDSFAVRTKAKNKPLISIGTSRGRNRPAARSIAYKDVLQMQGRGIVLSFIPDPMSPVYASWGELREIGVGEFLQVHLKDGTKRHGVFLRAADSQMSLLRGNRKIELDRADVTRVYRVTGDTRGLSSKLLRGGQKGTEVSDGIFPILDPSARAHPAALGIGAAVGALLYLLPKRGTRRVLVLAQ